MEEFLNYLVPQLCDNKEQVKIEKLEEEGSVTLLIHVAKEDMGKIIGKEGKVINSIRNLVKILAVKENKHVIVNLAEPAEPQE